MITEGSGTLNFYLTKSLMEALFALPIYFQLLLCDRSLFDWSFFFFFATWYSDLIVFYGQIEVKVLMRGCSFIHS